MNRYLLCYQIATAHSQGSWSNGHVFTSLPALTESALNKLVAGIVEEARKQAPAHAKLDTLVWTSCTKLDPEPTA